MTGESSAHLQLQPSRLEVELIVDDHNAPRCVNPGALKESGEGGT